jgi:50S ribosomal subunit-associated GTPase HflX
LLGEQRAKTDVLPMTAEITQYQLQPAGVPTRFVLLDTVGYGHEGPNADQRRATEEAARQSDLLLLVMHARNPARQADVDLLRDLRAWFAARPDLRMPPILGVLTHIDLLSPAMEWAPPYDWQEPKRAKEKHILRKTIPGPHPVYAVQPSQQRTPPPEQPEPTKPRGDITSALSTIEKWSGDVAPLKKGLGEKQWEKEERAQIKAALDALEKRQTEARTVDVGEGAP